MNISSSNTVSGFRTADNQTTIRSLVNPGAQSNASKYKKCKLPVCSSKHGATKKTEIQRNFSTKSLMERFTSGGSGSDGPGYSPIRKCETVLALSEVQSEVKWRFITPQF